MKKWIIAVVIVGLLGYAVYDFTTSKSKSTTDEIQSSQIESDGNSQANNGNGNVGLKKGNKAPNFELETLDGETVSLEDYLGEKIILNFCATWCPPCRTEMPDMQKFHSETGATILAVNLIETEKSEDGVREFLEEYGVTFTVLADADTRVSTLYNASALPTSYLINTKGEVHNIAIGALTYEMMVQAFDEME